MNISRHRVTLMALLLILALASPAAAAEQSEALVIGDTFTVKSEVMGETRRINVYLPGGYSAETPLSVLYMPDGGLAEDFLHIAGLVQISVLNGTMRPFMLVGIENTERRRDMTGPTENEKDMTIAPRVGGSATFREFIRKELMPEVCKRYATTGETAIVGESLAGLFVVETFLLEPDLFDIYLAFDPSIWWNDQYLVNNAEDLLRSHPDQIKNLYLAAAGQSEIVVLCEKLAGIFRTSAPAGLSWHYEPMPDETHATIYHPAALQAFREVLANPTESK